MRREHADLWERLQSFEFDKPNTKKTFRSRLAKENGWSTRTTNRAITEYQRFLFTAATCGHAVAPPKVVDQVWHQHLIYTRSYWDELCPAVFGRPFHHEPSIGTAEEEARLAVWYERTWNSYCELFGSEPPHDLWPKPCKCTRQPSISEASEELPHGLTSDSRLAVLAALPLSFATVFPFDLKGPDFLIFYLTLAASGFVAALLLRHLLREPDNHEPHNDLTNYELACLIANEERAVEAAIVKLVQDEKIAFSEDETGLFGLKKIVRLRNLDRRRLQDPLEQTVTSAIDATGGDVADVIRTAAREAKFLSDRLKSKRLLESAESFSLAIIVSTTIMAVVLATGAVKLWIGVNLGKPVGNLVVDLLAVLAQLPQLGV